MSRYKRWCFILTVIGTTILLSGIMIKRQLPQGVGDFRQFLSNGFNYHRQYQSTLYGIFYRVAHELKLRIKKDSNLFFMKSVQIPDHPMGDYYLNPELNFADSGNDAEYLIGSEADLIDYYRESQSADKTEQELRKFIRSNFSRIETPVKGYTIFAKSEMTSQQTAYKKEFDIGAADSLHVIVPQFLGIQICFLFLGVILLLITGILKADYQISLLGFSVLSYLLGLLTYITALNILSMFFIPLSGSNLVIVFVVLFLGLGLILRKHHMLMFKSLYTSALRSVSKNSFLGAIPPTSLLFICLIGIVLQMVCHPPWAWDSISHWLPKANAIFYYEALFPSGSHHNNYPVFWPLTVAVNYILIGVKLDIISRWILVIFIFCMLVMARECALRLMPGNKPIFSYTWFMLFFLIYFYDFYHSASYAENMITLLILSALTYLLLYFNDLSPGRLMPLCLLLLGITLTKREGQYAVAIIIASFFIATSVSKKYEIKHLLIFGLVAIITILPQNIWVLWQHQVGSLTDANQLSIFEWRKWTALFETTVRDIKIINKRYLVFYLTLGVFVFLSNRRSFIKPVCLFYVLVAGGLMAFASLALLSWGADTIVKNSLAAIPRLFLHATPPLFLLWVYFFKSSWDNIKPLPGKP